MPRINQAHEQFVLDIAYDFYGERMATCSMDKTIKVWELSKHGSGSPDSPGGAWSLSGTVQLDFVPRRITWAHPEYGQILACCGESRVLVLEELLGGNVIQHTESDRDESGAISAAATRPAAKSRWKKKAQLLESHTEVRDVEFAPRQYGLKLAAAASDGVVRIYEAINVVEGDWSQQSEFHTKGEVRWLRSASARAWSYPQLSAMLPSICNVFDVFLQAFAVSWRKLAFATERIAVATSQGTHVWEFNGRNQAWEKVMNLRRTFAGISGEFERDAKQIQDVAWVRAEFANAAVAFHPAVLSSIHHCCQALLIHNVCACRHPTWVERTTWSLLLLTVSSTFTRSRSRVPFAQQRARVETTLSNPHPQCRVTWRFSLTSKRN